MMAEAVSMLERTWIERRACPYQQCEQQWAECTSLMDYTAPQDCTGQGQAYKRCTRNQLRLPWSNFENIVKSVSTDISQLLIVLVFVALSDLNRGPLFRPGPTSACGTLTCWLNLAAIFKWADPKWWSVVDVLPMSILSFVKIRAVRYFHTRHPDFWKSETKKILGILFTLRTWVHLSHSLEWSGSLELLGVVHANPPHPPTF